MDDSKLQTFADNYSSADFDKVKFEWNGEHGKKFHDNNYAFRMQLCEFLIPQLSTTKLELIRDLYIELSKWAKESWAIYGKYYLFAQQLLNRGGTVYIIDYLWGAGQSFDTLLASGRMNLSTEQKENILNFINESIKLEKDQYKLKLLTFGQERFQRGFNGN